jgi:diguanylate cyclase (GGDEF)-like protein
VTATDGEEAWSRLQQDDPPRLLILDWMMPGLDGVEICRELRKREDPAYTYILLVTAKFQRCDIIEGLEAGADDYITKPFDAGELRARLRTGRRILELHEELVQARDRLQYQASHDAMTGVWNRAAIQEILQAEVARAQREKIPAGILLLDLDHFKQINDQYGHLAGDSVLREAARRMKGRLRAYDSVGRYGGEEFLVVLPGCDQTAAAHQAERLRQAISEKLFDVPEGEIPVTISIGATSTSRDGGGEIDSLLRAADAALYRAKEGGRNRVECAPHVPACEPLPVAAPRMELRGR